MLTHSIAITLPHPAAITRAMARDHGPALRRAAGAIAVVLVAVYVAGETGYAWLRQLLAWPGLPPLPPWGPPDPVPVPRPAPVPAAVLQHQAPAALPVISRRDACRCLRAQGLSPAKIGRELGISRSTVRRELA